VRDRIRRAAAVLRSHWDARRVTENPQRADGVAACCNLLGAYYALGETAEALSVAKQALGVVPDDQALLQRAAIAGLEAQDDVFVAGLVDRLPKSPEGVMIRLQFYAHNADWEKLVQLAELADVVPEHERQTLQTMGLLAKLMMTGPHADCHADLEHILDAAADDARALILVCDFALTLKQTDISVQAYQRAVSLIDGASYRTGRSMVARTAGRRED
jgi:lipopolysaccharide biosynthesis regulator YciM